MKNKARKYIIVLMAVACVFSTLPFSTFAQTPIAKGIQYTYVDENPYYGIEHTPSDGLVTEVSGKINPVSFSGSPIPEFAGASVDIVTAEILNFGYIHDFDMSGVLMNIKGDFIVYVPGLTPIPTYFDEVHIQMIIQSSNGYPKPFVILVMDGQAVGLYAENVIKIELTDIANADRTILSVALEHFEAEMTAEGYANMALDGYSSIVNVFVNNAKQFYEIDNPFIVISIAVFGVAILLAICTLIIKSIRRY